MAIDLSTTEKKIIKAALQCSSNNEQRVFDLAEAIADDMARIDGCLSLVLRKLGDLNLRAADERELDALLAAIDRFGATAAGAAQEISTSFGSTDAAIRTLS